MNKKGFTLLEMLVVIGIISILVTIAAASYSTAMKKSRDTRRKSDMSAIQNAMEQYYSSCYSKYKDLAVGALPATIATVASPTCEVLAVSTILTVPDDPQGGSYQCVGTCDDATYTICPPVLSNGKYLETEDCTVANRSCCLSNRQ